MYAQFDAKILYLICVFLFELGSAVCGAAPNMDALIIGRAICGWGGAGMYTGVMTLLSVTTTEHERPTYIGFTGLTWGAGTVLGKSSVPCMVLDGPANKHQVRSSAVPFLIVVRPGDGHSVSSDFLDDRLR